MSFLNNLSLTIKLYLMLFFPILGLLIFASLQSFNYYDKYQSMEKIETLTLLSQKVSKLVHETQKERGMTAGFIGSKGVKFKDKLPNQRELSNNRYEEFKTYSQTIDFSIYPKEFKNNINKTIEKFEGLNEIRGKVNNLKIAGAIAISYYTKMNAVILANVKLIAKLTNDADIAREVLSYGNFLLSKERAGIERAVGTNTLARGDFAPGLKTRYTNLITAQNVLLDSYFALATKKSKDFFNDTMKGKDIDEVMRIRKAMISGTFNDKPEYWFEQITSKINKLKTVDNKLALNLIENVSIIKERVFTALLTTIIASLIALSIALFLGSLISHKITSSLKDFILGLDNFFDFLNYKVDDVELLNNKDKDEFGEMAQKVNENIIRTKENIIQDRKLIDETIEVSNSINKGYLDKKLTVNSANPALNELKNILNEMITNLNNSLKNIESVLKSYINLDYRPSADKKAYEGVIESLIDGINNLGETITEDLIKNKRNGLVLGNSANTLKTNVDNITTSSNEAAASLEETAAALEEITSTIISNSDNVTQMTQYASKVTNSVSAGEKLAANTMSAMDEINEQVSSINEAISVIDQIAFQTNILSLNAAVEAATAGEAGKGFAVVAQEVRNLASRSAEAAKEIKDIVETANIKSNTGKEITQNMLEGYKDLNVDITKTLELISDVEAASKEQQSGIEQINDAVTLLDQQTQTNAASALETNDIAISTEKLAQSIIKNVDEKEFRGKNETQDRRKNYKDLNYNKEEKRSVESHIKSRQAKNEIVEKSTNNSNDSQWENSKFLNKLF